MSKKSPAVPRSQMTWINPVGNLGDMLLLSGVLNLVLEKFPAKKFNLVRRSGGYMSFFRSHPAIAEIGSPQPGAAVIATDYWTEDAAEPAARRPFQVLAKRFGLPSPVAERLYFPGDLQDDDTLNRFIPWNQAKVAVIATGADSPRKAVPPLHWHHLVEKLNSRGIFVIQVGRPNEVYIKGAFSMLGLTSTAQLIQLVKKSDIVISVDNDLVQISRLTGTPAVVLWGPTDPDIRGFPAHVNLAAPLDSCTFREECREKSLRRDIPTPCPSKNGPCLEKIPLDFVLFSVYKIVMN